MSDSIYAPPEAELATEDTSEPRYYVVGPRKFFLLSILTLNGYLVYWFYRNWHLTKKRTGENMWPPMRGLFYIFFTHSLFVDVDEHIKSADRNFKWQPGTIATFVVLLTITSNILDRLAAKYIGSPMTDVASLLLVPVIPAILLGAQRAINFACEDPSGSGNSNFTVANWLWMALGAVIWVFITIGVYAMLFAPELLLE